MPASGTANRGVEAKEYEIADTVLDENSLGGSQGRASSTHTHTFDETNSYIQVVVQKQRRGREARLPAASSPTPAPHKLRKAERNREEGGGECGDDATLLLLPSRPPLLLLPPLALAAMSPTPALHRNAHECVRKEFQHGEERAPGGAAGDAPPRAAATGKTKCKASWRLFSLNGENLDSSDCGPSGFEVYYFESAEASHLASVVAAPAPLVSRMARVARRRGGALLAELLAAARLPLAAPGAVLLAVTRCGLELVRDAVGGALQTASDVALKPALAALHNALLQPPLVMAASVARGVRSALQPVFALLGDALDPLVRVLQAVRLVHVHVERAPARCSCGHGAKDTTHV